MTVPQLLAALHDKGIALWTDDDKLCYRAPRGALTEALKSQLVERKAEIILFLKAGTRTPRAIPEAPPGTLLPLSFAEEGLWLLEQISPGTGAWNMQSGLRLWGALDSAALERSLNALVLRHETLRTSYRLVEGKVVREVAPVLGIELPLSPLDFSNGSDAQIRRIAAEEEKCVFDLSTAPLFRARLLRVSETEHYFLYTVHHIVSDSWSTRIFYRDLLELYGAYVQNRTPALSELPIRYSDYAAWIRHQRQETPAPSLAYWMKKLEGFAIQEIPADYRRPDRRAYRGATQSIPLEMDLTRGMRELCRRERATTFMLLAAAFKVLLRRYTASDDIVVGSALAGRTRPELEDLIGMFINVLPLRTSLGGKPSFRETLRRVREVCLEAYQHQDMPYQKLIEAFNPGRGAGRNPFFQVLFDIVNLPPVRLDAHGLTSDFLDRPENTARYEMVIRAPETAEGMEIRIDYAVDIFSPARIAELLQQYRFLLRQIVENPDGDIDGYALQTESARAALPDPTTPLGCLWTGAAHQLMAQRASERPDKVAVADAHESWTYRELDCRSNRLANLLRDRGVAKEDVVAIYGRRGISLVWAIMGILKAGGAFFIIDPSHPAQRIREYLDAVRPKALVTLGEFDARDREDAISSAVSEGRRIHVPSAAAAECLNGYSEKDPGLPVDADDLACVIFTSGSTGKPKGVLGRHGPLTQFLPWVVDTFEISGEDRFSALGGVSSNILQREVFTALSLGATLFVADPDLVAPGKLDSWLVEHTITVTHLTPAMARVLDEGARRPIPCVRRVFFAGDLLKQRDVEAIRRWMPSAQTLSFYASSESQRASAYKILPRETDDRVKEIPPLGRGVKDVQLLVVNDGGQIAGIGEIGEIWVRSPHLARGYLDDEGLTNERFIVNPFTGDASDRIFRTGERGRFLPDGEVEFAGRAEHQASIRGFRVELGEVESALLRHPGVREAVVAAREDGAGDKRLVAYLVPRREPAPTTSELRAFLTQSLPEYMVPSGFVLLDTLPMTPSGKVSREQLPQLDQRRPRLKYEYAAPRTPVEKLLAEIWAEILNLDRVGIHDNFFDLGGHSILAVRLAAEIERKFRKNVPVAMPFQAPTIAHMAKALSRLGGAAPSSLLAVQPAGRKIPFFCIHGDDGHALLARHLGAEQPFYGLTRNLDPKIIRGGSIEKLAEHYLEDIRRVQRRGPYCLGGHSFGAVIAFEIACQLRAAGEQVAFLALLDPAHPGDNAHRAGLRGHGTESHWTRLLRAAVKTFRHARHMLSRALSSGAESPIADDHGYRRLFRDSLKRYAVRPYEGPVALFRPEIASDPSDPWHELLRGSVEIFSVPGDGRNFMDDASLVHLAPGLRKSLNNAQQYGVRTPSENASSA